MSFSRPLPSMGWNVPRALLGIILSAEGVFPSGFSFLVSGSHQASKLWSVPQIETHIPACVDCHFLSKLLALTDFHLASYRCLQFGIPVIL